MGVEEQNQAGRSGAVRLRGRVLHGAPDLNTTTTLSRPSLCAPYIFQKMFGGFLVVVALLAILHGMRAFVTRPITY